jgi:tRNA-dihydrouridine synthase
MRRHLRMMMSFYDDYGLVLFRKHAVKYLFGQPYASALRNALVTCESTAQFFDLLDGYEARREYFESLEAPTTV